MNASIMIFEIERNSTISVIYIMGRRVGSEDGARRRGLGGGVKEGPVCDGLCYMFPSLG